MRVDSAGINNYIKPPQIQIQKTTDADLNEESQKIKKEPALKTAAEEKKDKRIEKLEDMRNNYAMLASEMENVRKQGEASAEATKIRIKCLKIAMRIMSGDEVPAADHRFLLEKDPGLYGQAIMMRMQKEHPEKHKRISEDDDFDDFNDEIKTELETGAVVETIPASADISAEPAELPETAG